MFQRTTRKVSLTAEGLAFLSDAQQIQALTHRALDRFAHPQDQPFVPFALGSVFHLHLLWLAPALRRLREELPSLHPMLQVAGGPYLQQLLEEVSYRALPSALVEKVEVDVGDLKVGDSIKVRDLSIASDKDIDLMTDLDAVVATVSAVHNNVPESETEEGVSAE